ncbi:MAG: hypothetical protein F9K36_16050 [Burkholderiaceae bacterium]|nr:MAG: hypothetical protein F9K36_16050 [Burkholderiaceae bacterium]
MTALRDASDPCDLLAALFRITQAFGARASACVHVVPDPERAPQLFVLLACEPERAYGHLQRESALDHPWLRYARAHSEPVWAASLQPPCPAEDHPVLIVPTHSGGLTGRFGVLMLEMATGDCGPSESSEQRVLAEGVAHELHDWWMRRTRADLQREARLRSADLHLLALERRGLASKQIARLLDSTVLAVDSRFQRINAKLGVANRRHAALRAAIHGLL